MQVIFCNLPSATSLGDLVEFAQKGVKPIFFSSKEKQIISCEILDITDTAEQRVEYHGVVTFASPAIAEKAIKKLNGKYLHGKKIKVREYIYRAPGDRRIDSNNQGLNRPEDRRRQTIDIQKRSEHDKDEPVITAYKHNRTYGK